MPMPKIKPSHAWQAQLRVTALGILTTITLALAFELLITTDFKLPDNMCLNRFFPIPLLTCWGLYLGLLPTGIAIDLLGARKILIWALSLLTLCAYCFSLLSAPAIVTYPALCVFGVAIGASLLAICQLFCRWLSHHRALLGISFLLGICGLLLWITPQYTLSWYHELGHLISWLGMAKMLLLITALCFLGISNHPKSRLINPFHRQQLQPFMKALQTMIDNWSYWQLGLIAGLFIFSASLWYTELGLALLKSHYAVKSLALLPSIQVLLVGLFLNPLFLVLSNYLQQRKPFLQIANWSLCIALFAIVILPISFDDIDGVFFVIGLALANIIIIFSTITELAPRQLHASTWGLSAVIAISPSFPLMYYMLPVAPVAWTFLLIPCIGISILLLNTLLLRHVEETYSQLQRWESPMS